MRPMRLGSVFPLVLAAATAVAEPASANEAARAKSSARREALPHPVRSVPSSDELTVLARLEDPSHSFHCGTLKVTTVERHRVVGVLSGHHPIGDIYVGVTCHEFYDNVRSDGGVVVPRWSGQVYRLRLERGGPPDGMVRDNFRANPSARYRLVDAPVWVPGGI